MKQKIRRKRSSGPSRLGATIVALCQTVHRLRAPGGCPWDRAQTHQSLRPYLIEEAYEVLEVLDQIHGKSLKGAPAKTKDSLREELGDLLMQVLLHSEMASEAGGFTFEDVAIGLNDKLVRRHPHVFGPEAGSAKSADAALRNWERQKASEKAKAKGRKGAASVLDGLPRSLPALQRTHRAIEKVSKVGFQWQDLAGPLAKVREELEELQEAVRSKSPRHRIEAELGDSLFSLCNLGYVLGLNAEDALRTTLGRFESRFRYVERALHKRKKRPEHSTLKEMDALWERAKSLEKRTLRVSASGD